MWFPVIVTTLFERSWLPSGSGLLTSVLLRNAIIAPKVNQAQTPVPTVLNALLVTEKVPEIGNMSVQTFWGVHAPVGGTLGRNWPPYMIAFCMLHDVGGYVAAGRDVPTTCTWLTVAETCGIGEKGEG